MALEKLTFEAFDNSDCANSLGQIAVFVNPDSYSHNRSVDYEFADVPGQTEKTVVFKGLGNETFSLRNLIVDGTGIVKLTGATSVDDYIKKLQNVVYKYNPKTHVAVFTKISWGSKITSDKPNEKFVGVCTSFNIKYTLFNSDGSTLRASIDIDFVASASLPYKALSAKKNSPDLTHMRTVQAGDTLPLMTYRIYGDSSYYLEVARFNKLNSINAIKPGDQVYFPPLKK